MAYSDSDNVSTWPHTPGSGSNKVSKGTTSPKAGWLGNLETLKEKLNHLLAAFRAGGHTHTGTDGDGPKIPEGGIADGAVVEAKLGTGSVTEPKLGTGAVTVAKFYTTSQSQGSVFFRGSAAWQVLANGLVGQVLRSMGAGADVEWAYTFPDIKRVLVAPYAYYSAFTGSGAGTDLGAGLQLATGATASSYLVFYSGLSNSASSANEFYDKNPVMSFVVERTAGDISTQKKFRMTTGLGAYNASDTTMGFGWRMEGATLYAWNANGTTATNTAIATFTATNVNHLVAVMTSGTNIKFYMNGTLVATHTTNLPSGSVQYVFSGRVDNGTDAAALTVQTTVPIISYER